MKGFGLVYFLILMNACVSENAPEVTIAQGTLRGGYRKTINGRTIRAFTGIPYAKPPVGDLRFKISVPAGPWEGILNASKLHAICPQIDETSMPAGDEDCLFLNVYTPPLADCSKNPLPVMVFIHGGSFGFGTANPYLYGPDLLLDKDVILVTINYRLGALGFLSTGDEILPGNNGLKDQTLALKWVKNNIQHFGGDPQRVTIFGQSAGGVSVSLHVVSPLSKGLFCGAIAQSGVSIMTLDFGSRSLALNNAKRLAQFLNCPTNTSQALVDCLAKVPANEIINQSLKFAEWVSDPVTPFKAVVEPNIEGAFLTDLPTEIMKSGNFSQVPFMGGVLTADGAIESAIIYNNSKLVSELNKDFIKLAPLIFQYDAAVPNKDQLSRKIREFYLGNRAIDDSTKSEVTNMITDAWFLAPQNYISLLQAEHSRQPVYYYLFGYRGTVSYQQFYGDTKHNYGAVHVDDLIYLFSSALFPNYTPSESDKKMINVMTTLWTNFAKTGNPTTELNGLIRNKWEPLKHDLKFYFIRNGDSVAMIKNPYLNRTIFWKNHPIFMGANQIQS